jgi:hypothetical protein
MTENIDTAKFCKQCASPLQQSAAKTCPAGKHTMDPTWTECVYCKQENAAPSPSAAPPVRTPTMVESQGAPRKFTEDENLSGRAPLPPRPPRPVPAQPQPAAGPKVQRDATVFRPVGSTPNPASGSGQGTPQISKGRKIVGILVTYSWTPEGKIFPVLEGRNFIGRDKDCEICVAEDETMSGRNSHITYRQSFVVGDMVSMAGTDLNGTPIEEQFHPLENYASIRAGSTYFTFIAVQPAAESPAGTL